MGSNPCRLVVVREGRLVVEWNYGVDRFRPLRLASASKSIYSNLLSIAVEEGVILTASTSSPRPGQSVRALRRGGSGGSLRASEG